MRRITGLFPFLALLFMGTLCVAMVLPYMAFFLVDGLGQRPWMIGVYSLLAVAVTVTANRQIALRLDNGASAFFLLGLAIAGFVLASAALSVSPKVWTALTFGAVGYGISSSAVSTMFCVGGIFALRAEMRRESVNAYMRATTSAGWMVGPAVSFIVSDGFGFLTVFRLCFIAGVFWALLWLWALPKDVSVPKQTGSVDATSSSSLDTGLAMALVFVFCLSFAHALTFSALPLFYVREVGLPGFAPGLSFTVKTFVEVIAIFSTPILIVQFGMRTSLLATALLAMFAITFLASVQSFPQMLIGAAFEGLYYGLFASLGISYVQSLSPERPAAATALYWNSLMISGLLAGSLVGVVASEYDFRTVVYLSSAVALLAFLVLWLGRQHGHRDAQRQA